MKNCFETDVDINMALLQIRSTPIGHGLLSLVTLLFKRPSRALLPKFRRPPMLFDNNESNHTVLAKSKSFVNIYSYSQKYSMLTNRINCSANMGGLDAWNSGEA